jgi:hypothetical protein
MPARAVPAPVIVQAPAADPLAEEPVALDAIPLLRPRYPLVRVLLVVGVLAVVVVVRLLMLRSDSEKVLDDIKRGETPRTVASDPPGAAVVQLVHADPHAGLRAPPRRLPDGVDPRLPGRRDRAGAGALISARAAAA